MSEIKPSGQINHGPKVLTGRERDQQSNTAADNQGQKQQIRPKTNASQHQDDHKTLAQIPLCCANPLEEKTTETQTLKQVSACCNYGQISTSEGGAHGRYPTSAKSQRQGQG